ncbi:protein MAIN-LIKE 2-like [Setaria viridis]|uniref:protein MAIN-LIKE 2-like n=1 Tax=Setaria viridis TaxID=4556 RepID=UPI0014932D3C|nr:protein MAIN-LIKE 2-like [Setaria viridis]
MVDGATRPGEKSTWFHFDMSLLAALLDLWRLETHTFHLPVDEMAPTLKNVSLLLGLPCVRGAVAAVDVPPIWRDELLDRFANADYMSDTAAAATVARHLEAYLLWLFGWIMLCTSQGNSVPKHLFPYVRAIAESPLDDVLQYSWGSAILATTYRGLCMGCGKVASAKPIFLGCPLLLQLWSYERFPIGRPRIDMSPYQELPLDHNDVNKPTMGSLWCLRKGLWVGVQTKKSYPDFVGEFNALVDTDVRWRPYTIDEVQARALHGLSSLCHQDMKY